MARPATEDQVADAIGEAVDRAAEVEALAVVSEAAQEALGATSTQREPERALALARVTARVAGEVLEAVERAHALPDENARRGPA